jgi:hypothetical protein
MLCVLTIVIHQIKDVGVVPYELQLGLLMYYFVKVEIKEGFDRLKTFAHIICLGMFIKDI